MIIELFDRSTQHAEYCGQGVENSTSSFRAAGGCHMERQPGIHLTIDFTNTFAKQKASGQNRTLAPELHVHYPHIGEVHQLLVKFNS